MRQDKIMSDDILYYSEFCNQSSSKGQNSQFVVLNLLGVYAPTQRAKKPIKQGIWLKSE